MSKKCLIFEAYPFFSGSQRITLNVCKILREEGYFITLLLADDKYGNLEKNFEKYVDEIKYVHVSPILLKYGNEDSWFTKKTFFKSIFLGLLPFYCRALKIIMLKQYDYLYCCDPRGAMMMMIPALFFKGKAILHFHGKNRLPRILSNFFIRVFDQIICVSNDVANSLPVSVKKKVIYNGIDFSQYIGNSDITRVTLEAEELAGMPSDKMVKFLYAGLLRPHKGVHHLIYAFAQLVKEQDSVSKPILFLCGAAKTPSEEAFRDHLVKYCIDQDIENNVYWLGWKDNVLEWMNFANYFIFPTIDTEENAFEGFGKIIESTEGLPTVLIESSLCGLFNVCADVTGVNEIVYPNENGYIYPSNGTKSLYDAIKYVYINCPKYSGFSARQQFSLKTFKKQIITIFNN